MQDKRSHSRSPFFNYISGLNHIFGVMIMDHGGNPSRMTGQIQSVRQSVKPVLQVSHNEMYFKICSFRYALCDMRFVIWTGEAGQIKA